MKLMEIVEQDKVPEYSHDNIYLAKDCKKDDGSHRIVKKNGKVWYVAYKTKPIKGMQKMYPNIAAARADFKKFIEPMDV